MRSKEWTEIDNEIKGLGESLSFVIADILVYSTLEDENNGIAAAVHAVGAAIGELEKALVSLAPHIKRDGEEK